MDNRYAFVLTIAGAGMFLSTLDSGVINVALPFLQQDFHTTVNTISWTISGYFLVVSATLVLFGKLGDRFGRVRIFSAGLLLFALGSLLCGLAFSAHQLIAWRALQALGAAAMQGTAAGIITTLIEPHYKNRALGMLGLIIGIGPVIGPTFAGTVITFSSWRWIFFVNIPICLLALLGARRLHDTGKYQQASLDGVGMVLFALTIFSLVLALTLGGHPDGYGLLIPGLALVALLSFLFFLYQERRTSSPMLDLRLFNIGSFNVSLIGMLTFGFVTAVIFMLPPLELHLIAHLSAWQIGLISLSAPLGVVILSRFSGMAINYWGEQRLVLIGLLVMLVAVLFLALRQPSWGMVSFPPFLFLYGVGGGIFIPPNMSTIMKAASAQHQGTMGAMNRMVLNLGNALGVAAASLVIGLHASQAQTQMTAGFQQIWLLAVGMLTITVVASIVDLRRGRALYHGVRDKRSRCSVSTRASRRVS
jgi:EmrB/QacA subfamily drug resistance transporter